MASRAWTKLLAFELECNLRADEIEHDSRSRISVMLEESRTRCGGKTNNDMVGTEECLGTADFFGIDPSGCRSTSPMSISAPYEAALPCLLRLRALVGNTAEKSTNTTPLLSRLRLRNIGHCCWRRSCKHMSHGQALAPGNPARCRVVWEGKWHVRMHIDWRPASQSTIQGFSKHANVALALNLLVEKIGSCSDSRGFWTIRRTLRPETTKKPKKNQKSTGTRWNKMSMTQINTPSDSREYPLPTRAQGNRPASTASPKTKKEGSA